MAKHQRKNAASNTRVGIDFEKLAMGYFKKSISDLTMPRMKSPEKKRRT